MPPSRAYRARPRPIHVSDTFWVWPGLRPRETPPTPVLRDRGRGVAFRSRGVAAAHGTATALPPDPRTRGRARHTTVQPYEAEGRAHGRRPHPPRRSAVGARPG